MMTASNGTICRRTRIKLCGVTSADEADLAIEAGVDSIGMVFTAGTPRSVLPHTAMQIARRVPPLVSVIGVFSNPSDPDLMAWPGRWVQLMGEESEPQIQRVARLRSIIKGFRYDATQMRRWDRCASVGAMLVEVEAADEKTITEAAHVASVLHTPIIIGGAITPATVGAWIKAVRPHGIDIGPAVTDRSDASLHEFAHAVREADAAD